MKLDNNNIIDNDIEEDDNNKTIENQILKADQNNKKIEENNKEEHLKEEEEKGKEKKDSPEDKDRDKDKDKDKINEKNTNDKNKKDIKNEKENEIEQTCKNQNKKEETRNKAVMNVESATPKDNNTKSSNQNTIKSLEISISSQLKKQDTDNPNNNQQSKDKRASNQSNSISQPLSLQNGSTGQNEIMSKISDKLIVFVYSQTPEHNELKYYITPINITDPCKRDSNESNLFFVTCPVGISDIQFNLHFNNKQAISNTITIFPNANNFIYSIIFNEQKTCLDCLKNLPHVKIKDFPIQKQFEYFFNFIQKDKDFYINDLIRDTINKIKESQNQYDADLYYELLYKTCKETSVVMNVFALFDFNNFTKKECRNKYEDVFRQVLEKDSVVRKKIDCGGISEELKRKFGLFELWYYYYSKAIEDLSNSLRIAETNVLSDFIEMIMKDSSLGDGLSIEQFTIVFNKAEAKNILDTFFDRFKAIEVLTLLMQNQSKANEHFRNKKLKLSTLTYNQSDEFIVMLKILKELFSNTENEFIDRNDDETLLQIFINFNKESSLETLIAIKKFIKEMEIKNINPIISKALLDIAQFQSKVNKLTNDDIINILDGLIEKEYELNTLIEIAQMLNVNSIQQNQIESFNQLNLEIINDKNDDLNRFIDAVLSSISRINDFEYSIKLFEKGKVSIEPFVLLFQRLVNKNKNTIEMQFLLQKMLQLIKFAHMKNSSNPFTEIILKLKTEIEEERFISFCLICLNENSTEPLKKMVMDQLVDIIQTKPIEKIVEVFNELNHHEQREMFLNTKLFENKTLKEDDFYFETDNDNLQLFKMIIASGHYAMLDKTVYYKTNNTTITAIRELIEKNGFRLSQITKLHQMS